MSNVRWAVVCDKKRTNSELDDIIVDKIMLMLELGEMENNMKDEMCELCKKERRKPRKSSIKKKTKNQNQIFAQIFDRNQTSVEPSKVGNEFVGGTQQTTPKIDIGKLNWTEASFDRHLKSVDLSKITVSELKKILDEKIEEESNCPAGSFHDASKGCVSVKHLPSVSEIPNKNDIKPSLNKPMEQTTNQNIDEDIINTILNQFMSSSKINEKTHAKNIENDLTSLREKPTKASNIEANKKNENDNNKNLQISRNVASKKDKFMENSESFGANQAGVVTDSKTPALKRNLNEFKFPYDKLEEIFEMILNQNIENDLRNQIEGNFLRDKISNQMYDEFPSSIKLSNRNTENLEGNEELIQTIKNLSQLTQPEGIETDMKIEKTEVNSKAPEIVMKLSPNFDVTENDAPNLAMMLSRIYKSDEKMETLNSQENLKTTFNKNEKFNLDKLQPNIPKTTTEPFDMNLMTKLSQQEISNKNEKMFSETKTSELNENAEEEIENNKKKMQIESTNDGEKQIISEFKSPQNNSVVNEHHSDLDLNQMTTENIAKMSLTLSALNSTQPSQNNGIEEENNSEFNAKNAKLSSKATEDNLKNIESLNTSSSDASASLKDPQINEGKLALLLNVLKNKPLEASIKHSTPSGLLKQNSMENSNEIDVMRIIKDQIEIQLENLNRTIEASMSSNNISDNSFSQEPQIIEESFPINATMKLPEQSKLNESLRMKMSSAANGSDLQFKNVSTSFEDSQKEVGEGTSDFKTTTEANYELPMETSSVHSMMRRSVRMDDSPGETTTLLNETTTSPLVTTASHVETTSALLETTTLLIEATTGSSEATTFSPSKKTLSPTETTLPADTTASPMETTTRNSESTTLPAVTTASPMKTTTKSSEAAIYSPAGTLPTTLPAGTAASPKETATLLTEGTTSSTEKTSSPIETTTSFVKTTSEYSETTTTSRSSEASPAATSSVAVTNAPTIETINQPPKGLMASLFEAGKEILKTKKKLFANIFPGIFANDVLEDEVEHNDEARRKLPEMSYESIEGKTLSDVVDGIDKKISEASNSNEI
ncbi:CLUMA_CG007298, isoform A [Clunio marinus]|uniref:CLUMA_CG007298, isoform A n=1 Tax=Clunio marinus TaxID=568069 RepID=A0A1J1I1Y6_9DIPT|nr:CLUMA_CG007298, isoform A [Clunio marinus]